MAFSKLLGGWAMAAGLAGLASFVPAVLAAPPASTQPPSAVAGGPGPLGSAQIPRLALDDAWLPAVNSDLNAEIIRIPTDASGDVMLETTVYRPDGPGPFPMIVFNHGKIQGDPRNQERSDPLSFAREFVRRGYVVVAPNRRGFAESGGTYEQDGCDVAKNGMGQAADVAATVDYMVKQPYVDAHHIAIAGTSHGGLATIAYGSEAASGVRALINFSGGLRQDSCEGWQNNLIHAFGGYGENAHVPSLWLYGDNDSIWSPALVQQMFSAYSGEAASSAKLVDFGAYKNDAHRLVGDRDGVQVWWPSVEAFLARSGMPTAVEYRVAAPQAPRATGYASIDAVSAVPFLDEAGRNGYRNFLKQYPSRAFAVSNSGAWSWAEGGDNPMAVAVSNCQKHSKDPCRLYAVNESVVWGNGTASADAGPLDAARTAAAGHDDDHSLASR